MSFFEGRHRASNGVFSMAGATLLLAAASFGMEAKEAAKPVEAPEAISKTSEDPSEDHRLSAMLATMTMGMAAGAIVTRVIENERR